MIKKKEKDFSYYQKWANKYGESLPATGVKYVDDDNLRKVRVKIKHYKTQVAIIILTGFAVIVPIIIFIIDRFILH